MIAPATRRILVVDDEAELRDLLAIELAASGFQVTTAADGRAAIDAARATRFDLAITDLRMPGMDGVETMRALRAIDGALPVLVATGYASDETEAEWQALGVSGLVRKPFSVEDLLDAVARALSPP